MNGNWITEGAAGVSSTASHHKAGSGPNPRAALQTLRVAPVSMTVARDVLKREHYLHSFPGGTKLSFGVYLEQSLEGVVTFGAGPCQAYRLVDGAGRQDCLGLTRFWLSDGLPPNSASSVLGFLIRRLRKHSNLKFLITYADPGAGHTGTIYRATGWIYTGTSTATPFYDVGLGPVHARTLTEKLGTRSKRYLAKQGLEVRRVPQQAKHRYLYFLDKSWRERLKVPSLPYPKETRAGGA